MAKDGTAHGNLDYFLSRNRIESDRLNEQHEIIKQVFNGVLIHPAIYLKEDSAILDAATGTGVWLEDVARSLPKAHIAGFDISDVQFAQKPELRLFAQNALQPFPSEHLKKYDYVHQRMVTWALTKSQWPLELRNLMSTLKPGGWIQLDEFSTICSEKEPKQLDRPAAGKPSQQYYTTLLKLVKLGKSSTVCSMEQSRQPAGTVKSFEQHNAILLKLTKLGNKDVWIADHIQEYMKEAGYQNVQVLRKNYYVGGVEKNPFGKAFAKRSFQNATTAVHNLIAPFLVAGGLPDQGLGTEEELNDWFRRFRQDVYETGYILPVAMAVGQKPIE